jgi:hypothetical protein
MNGRRVPGRSDDAMFPSSRVECFIHSENFLQLTATRVWHTATSIPEAEFVAQDIIAVDRIDGQPAGPTLAAHFTADRGAPGLDGFGEFVAQIEIAADTFGVDTIESEDGLCVREVHVVFDFIVPAVGRPGAVDKFHPQRFQLRKLLRKTHGLAHPLLFLLAILRTGSCFLGPAKTFFDNGEFNHQTRISRKPDVVSNNRTRAAMPGNSFSRPTIAA